MLSWLKKSVNSVRDQLFWSVGGNGQVIFHNNANPLAGDDPFPNLTAENAYRDAGLFAAHSTIASSIASMPLKLYKGPENNKVEARDHPVWRLIDDEPNPKQTAFEWKQWIVTELMMHRNAFCVVQRAATDQNRPLQLLPVEQARVQVQTAGDDRIRYVIRDASTNWTTVYDGCAPRMPQTPALGGKSTVYDPQNVLHFRLFSTSSAAGLPLLAHGKTAIGLNVLLEEVAARYVKNGGSSARFFKTMKGLSPEAQRNFLEEMAKQISGRNFGAMAMLVEGMDVFESKSAALDDMQNLESRTFGVGQNARLAGIQPHLIADLSRSTNNNIEHQGLEYVTYRLLAIGEAIEQRIEKTLLTPAEREQYHVEFDYSNFLRGDMAARREFVKAMFNIGAYDVDECRAELGKNPLPNGAGKARYVPVNMMQLGKDTPVNANRTAK